MNRRTNRAVKALGSVILGISLSLTIASCAENSGNATNNGTETSDRSDADLSTSYPITLDTAWGSTTLKEKPKRIAVLDTSSTALDVSLSMGILPIAANKNILPYKYLSDLGADKIEFKLSGSGNDDISLDELASANPDLIVAPNWDLSEKWEGLSAIAPVIGSLEKYNSANEYRKNNAWDQIAESLGSAIGKQDVSKNLISQSGSDIASVRADNPEFDGKTVAYLVAMQGKTLYDFSTHGSAGEQFFQELGFDGSDRAEGQSKLSLEMVSSVDADVLVVAPHDEISRTEYEEIINSSIFQNSPQAKIGKVVYIDSEKTPNLPWALATDAPAARAYSVNSIVPELSAVLK